MRARSGALIIILGSLTALILLVWCANRFVVVREDAMPDHFYLGKVYVGSTVEFSARFLVSSRKHPFDAGFERMVKWLPQSWSPMLSKLHPKNFRAPPARVDPAKLKPVVSPPTFVCIDKVAPEQRTNWYQGRPFVVVHMTIDTARPGDYSGVVTLTLDRRRASLPLRISVREKPGMLPRLLIASTPYESYATEHGSNFYAAAKLLSSLALSTDYLHEFPASLEPYQVVLLADSALAGLKEEEIARTRSFVERGGRLLLACNAFMSGSVPHANQVLTNYGLHVVDEDYGGFVTVTNLAPDVLSEGVRRLEFHRPSLIKVTDDSRAKAVALAPDGTGGLVAVSRTKTGGEITVLTSSLWWHWLDRFETNSDNFRLMQNILGAGKPSD